jgi:hypothetical protein
MIIMFVLDTTLCDKICQWLATGRWFSLGTPVSSVNKTDRHDIAEILFKVALNTINESLTKVVYLCYMQLVSVYDFCPWLKCFSRCRSRIFQKRDFCERKKGEGGSRLLTHDPSPINICLNFERNHVLTLPWLVFEDRFGCYWIFTGSWFN